MVEKLCISINMSIRETIKIMDMTAKKILIVTDNKKVLGTITDGDIRRWILKNGDLESTADNIMNKNPICLHINQKSLAKRVMKESLIEAIPIIDDNKNIVEIIFLNEDLYDRTNNKILCNPVVIMAGGKGTRLYPYTQILPKPLIPIGDISIIERIIEKFTKSGCDNFYFTINYKKNMIKAYFDELQKNYKVTYIEEEKFLGTAGSLYMLKGRIKETFFLSNCDILVEADYSDILQYHKEKQNLITIVTSLKNYQIPYGVIELNECEQVIKTVEKPEFNYLVNAGFYILEPECLEDIPQDKFFHITDLINMYIKENKKVGTYPISENSWLDMGEFKEMERMVEILGVRKE